MNALYLIAGGSLGTLARYYVTGRVSDAFVARGLGVFVVNIVGSFIIGLFLTLSEERFLWPSQLRLLVAVGFSAPSLRSRRSPGRPCRCSSCATLRPPH